MIVTWEARSVCIMDVLSLMCCLKTVSKNSLCTKSQNSFQSYKKVMQGKERY